MKFARAVALVLCITTITQAFAAPVSEFQISSAASIEELRARYPGAKVIPVDPSEWPQLQSRLRQLGVEPGAPRILLVQNTDALPAAPESTGEFRAIPPSDSPCVSANGANSTAGDPGVVEMTMRVVARSIPRGSNDEEVAVVIFILAGFIVIYALIAYTGKYMYDSYSGFRECPKWWDLTLQTGAFGGDRDGNLSSIRLSTGVGDDVTRIGLTGELGTLRLDSTSTSASIQSTYWMLGPAVRWYHSAAADAMYFSAEILAGAATHDRLGAVSTARIGLNFPVSSGVRFGISLGALYTDVKRASNALSNDSELHSMVGLELGTRF